MSRILMPVTIGVLAAFATFCAQVAQAQATEAAQPDPVDAGIVAELVPPSTPVIGPAVQAVASDPFSRFALAGAALTAFVWALVGYIRPRFEWFSADSDAAKLRTLWLSIALGVLLGIVGLAPAVPRAPLPIVGDALGGALCGAIATVGATARKRQKRIKSAKAGT